MLNPTSAFLEVDKQNEENSSDSDDCDDAERSTPRRRYKRPKKEDSAIPAWQKSKDFARYVEIHPWHFRFYNFFEHSLLSEEMSSPSDDDVIEVNGGPYMPSEKQNGKRKRMRSRSRSITPPPALPVHQILNAKRIVRYDLCYVSFHVFTCSYATDKRLKRQYVHLLQPSSIWTTQVMR